MGDTGKAVYTAFMIFFYGFIFVLMIVYLYKRLKKKNFRSEQQNDLLNKINVLTYMKTESDDRRDR